MDSSSLEQPISSQPINSPQNYIIIVLSVLLVLALLGINIFIIFGNILQQFMNWISPYINQIFGNLGYASGNLVDKSGDLVADAAKTGIDIVNGAVGNVGDLLIRAGQSNNNNNTNTLDNSINKPPVQMRQKEPEPTPSTSPIQNPISSGKNNWCFVGEFESKRGCVAVNDATKCLSGQLFPTKEMCLNPTMTKQ